MGTIDYCWVTKFNKSRLCKVEMFGAPQRRYSPDQTLWVERAEDLYGQSHYKEPYCILDREDFLKGIET